MESILKYFPNITEKQKEQFAALYDLYYDWNSKINVISRKDIENLYLHHVLHSLAIAKYITFKPGTSIMDMGCGTGVFAILSMKMGAEYAKAIDIDVWAAENAKENANKNSVSVDVLLGDASLLSENEKFDIFFANINRNILLADMQTYSNSIQEGGVLFLSGFYTQDVAILEAECKEFGLELTDVETKDNWAAMRLVKTQK